MQVRTVKSEYSAEYQEKSEELEASLGSSIVAKARLFQFAVIARFELVSTSHLPRRQIFISEVERTQSGVRISFLITASRNSYLHVR